MAEGLETAQKRAEQAESQAAELREAAEEAYAELESVREDTDAALKAAIERCCLLMLDS